MKILSINTSDPTELVIEFQGVNLSILNALRRIILSEIPSVAIEDVVFHENSGVIENEIISHRLGLIPIKCQDINNVSTISFNYTAKQPTTIYAKDLVCEGCEIVYPNIVLTKLGKNHSLKFVAYTDKGIGRDHSKWKVVSNCYFKQIENNIYKFFIEPIGNISSQDIFRLAFDILKTKVEKSKNILLDVCNCND